MYTIYCNNEKTFRFNGIDTVTNGHRLVRHAGTLAEAKDIYNRCIKQMTDLIDEYAKKGVPASVRLVDRETMQLDIEDGAKEIRFYLVIRNSKYYE